MNPRDAAIVGEVRLHRMIRRGTTYGPPLPAGVLEDDGAERGLMFAFVGAHLARQFEFVQRRVGQRRQVLRRARREGSADRAEHGSGQITIPQQPIRRTHRRAAGVRGQPRRRVLLHAQPECAALARRAGYVTRQGDKVTR